MGNSELNQVGVGAEVVGDKCRTVLSNVFGNTIVVDIFECGSVALYMNEGDRHPLYFSNPQQTSLAEEVLNSLDFFDFDLTRSGALKQAA